MYGDFFSKFQSTLPVRGATLPVGEDEHPSVISIHAPREGSDGDFIHLAVSPLPFQSTLPVRGATITPVTLLNVKEKFQSTLPVRGATTFQVIICRNEKDFNPRSP